MTEKSDVEDRLNLLDARLHALETRRSRIEFASAKCWVPTCQADATGRVLYGGAIYPLCGEHMDVQLG